MKFEHILIKYKNYLLVIAIVLSALAVSIRGNDGKVFLTFQDYPDVIFLMVVISVFLFVLYIQISKRKIGHLTNQIKEQSKGNSEDFSALLAELTTRQKEVYELIISGKTNKEIMSELFIEQSTLKTHVNHIYKKLDIKNRNELKSKIKD
jgi:DNA-binding CsgD family transcriptional regulator